MNFLLGPPPDQQDIQNLTDALNALASAINGLTLLIDSILSWESSLFNLGLEHGLMIMVTGIVFGTIASLIRNQGVGR